MLLFNKQMHDFGTVAKDSEQLTVFQYLGEEELKGTDFVTNCSCTSGIYDPVKKEYTVGLKTRDLGEKSTSVTVKGNTFLVLKMMVV